MLPRTAAALLALASLTSCGYFQAGTWEDDPRNWERAFGAPVPEGVRVIHSNYSRFPHFTREEILYFQLQLSPKSQEKFFQKPFVRAEGDTAVEKKRGMVFPDAPKWFAPGEASQYEVWFDSGDYSNGLLLRHRVTGDVFLFAAQL